MVKESRSCDKTINENNRIMQGFQLYKDVKLIVSSSPRFAFASMETTFINNMYLLQVTMKNGDVYFGHYNDVMTLLAKQVNKTVLNSLGLAKRPF